MKLKSFIRKLSIVMLWVWLAVIVIVACFMGIPYGTGPSVFPLENYPLVDGYTIAVKSESVRMFYLPLVKWRTEYIAYKGELEKGTSYNVVNGDLLKEIELKYGDFNEHIPWQHKYGWLVVASFCVLLFSPLLFLRE